MKRREASVGVIVSEDGKYHPGDVARIAYKVLRQDTQTALVRVYGQSDPCVYTWDGESFARMSTAAYEPLTEVDEIIIARHPPLGCLYRCRACNRAWAESETMLDPRRVGVKVCSDPTCGGTADRVKENVW